MHIDGLRFDLASIFGRDEGGHVLLDPPIIEEITEDGILADTKLIAEPWDAAGALPTPGSATFPFGHRWAEWNGRYRDDVRRFWRGEPGMAGELATRLCGSADLYEGSGRNPRHSLNFITCHDGFTLHDLVSYNNKHNEQNGEGNRDGMNENFSWNCGIEGTTSDPDTLRLRRQQAKNLMTTLMLSQAACRCCTASATSSSAASAATTTPGVRTTSSPGSTGGSRTRTPTSSASRRS